MFELPTSITINEKCFPIRNKGDFRVIQDCFVALNDLELEKDYRILTSLIIFYEDLSDIEDVPELFPDEDMLQQAVEKMFSFFNCNEKHIGAEKPYRLIDWEKDEQLVVSSVNAVAHAEVRSLPYMHWWTFMGYFLNIHEGMLSHIVGIREKIVKGKKLEKYEMQFRQENPQYFQWEWKTQEQLEDEKLIQEMWGD